MKTVELITRNGCHLCDLVLGELDLLREILSFDVRLTHLEDAPDLEPRFGNDIPVIRVDGKEVCRHRLDREALLAALSGSETPPSR